MVEKADDGSRGKWRFDPIEPSDDSFHKEPGRWFFSGQKAPQFQEALWWFTGAEVLLEFVKNDDSRVTKFRTDGAYGPLSIAADSPASLRLYPLIEATFTKKIKAKKTAKQIEEEGRLGTLKKQGGNGTAEDFSGADTFSLKSDARAIPFRLVAPLGLKSDFWTFEEDGLVRKVGMRWSIRIIGPGRSMGKWIQTESTDPETKFWQWTPTDPANSPYIKEKGAWIFKGDKPIFESLRWVMVGNDPDLSFHSEEKVLGTKIKRAADKKLEISRDSMAAKRLRPLIEKTLEFEATIKGQTPAANASALNQKKNESKELSLDIGETAEDEEDLELNEEAESKALAKKKRRGVTEDSEAEEEGQVAEAEVGLDLELDLEDEEDEDGEEEENGLAPEDEEEEEQKRGEGEIEEEQEKEGDAEELGSEAPATTGEEASPAEITGAQSPERALEIAQILEGPEEKRPAALEAIAKKKARSPRDAAAAEEAAERERKAESEAHAAKKKKRAELEAEAAEEQRKAEQEAITLKLKKRTAAEQKAAAEGKSAAARAEKSRGAEEVAPPPESPAEFKGLFEEEKIQEAQSQGLHAMHGAEHANAEADGRVAPVASSAAAAVALEVAMVELKKDLPEPQERALEPVAEKPPGPNVTPLAIAFYASEIMASNERDPEVIAKNLCRYVTKSCGGISISLWLHTAGAWEKCVSAGREEPDLADDLRQSDVANKKGFVTIAEKFSAAVVCSKEGKLLGVLACSGPRFEALPADYVIALGQIVTGIMLSINMRRASAQTAA